ncbi:hypothetical protein PR048_031138 [Dryococelus australis]|uniref:Uncharacterized protein n=1 Tax=Dryococelus australis TaxID=614101 RepID=A0ABQ9G4G0_9NEOP|nr:hypothetical protein PR048_031138 [Dryococelus australis]
MSKVECDCTHGEIGETPSGCIIAGRHHVVMETRNRERRGGGGRGFVAGRHSRAPRASFPVQQTCQPQQLTESHLTKETERIEVGLWKRWWGWVRRSSSTFGFFQPPSAFENPPDSSPKETSPPSEDERLAHRDEDNGCRLQSDYTPRLPSSCACVRARVCEREYVPNSPSPTQLTGRLGAPAPKESSTRYQTHGTGGGGGQRAGLLLRSTPCPLQHSVFQRDMAWRRSRSHEQPLLASQQATTLRQRRLLCTASPSASYHGKPDSIPGRVTPGFSKLQIYRTMPLVGGFSRCSPVSPDLTFRPTPFSPHATIIASQDLIVKSRPKLSTQPELSNI